MNRFPYYLALILFTITFPVMTAPFLESPDNRTSIFSQFAGSDSADLQKVISLLNKGDKQEAKLALARFLTIHPQDPRGTEIAGLIFMEEKNWNMAETSFRRVLGADPKRASARSKLGVVLLMDGKTEEGITELKRSVLLNSVDPMARRYLGWLAESQGDIAEAITHYDAMIAGKTEIMSEFHVLISTLYNQNQQHDKTIRLLSPLIGKGDSNRVEQGGQLVLANAYLEQRNKEKAAEIMRSLEKITPAMHPDLRMAQAKLFRLEKKYSKSRELLQSVIKDTPAYKNLASFQLSQVYVEEGDWEQAVKILESLAMQADKKDLSKVLASLTSLQFEHNKSDDAIKMLKKYASQDPMIKYLLAEAQARDAQYDAALITIRNLLDSHPNFAAGHYLSGMVNKHMGNMEVAQTGFQQAVKLIPAFVDAWIELAELYVALKALPKAENTLLKGLEANLEQPALLFKLASIQSSLGKVNQANEIYRRILKSFPNDVPTLNNLASNLSVDMATLDEAKEYAKYAYGLDKNGPITQDTYGWILIKSGETSQGITLLESVVKNLRDHVGILHEGNAYYHLGVGYIKTGKIKEGENYLNLALKSGVDSSTKVQIEALLKK